MSNNLKNCPQLKQFSQRLFQITQHLHHSSRIKWIQQNKNWTDHVNVARCVERIKAGLDLKKGEFEIQRLSCFVFCIFSLIKTHVQLSIWHLKFYFLNQGVEIIIPKTGCVFTEGNKTYLEESMETWFLFLTSSDGLLTHFKEVDKRWVGLHQLFRLGRRWRGRRVRDSRNGFMQYLIGPERVGVHHFTESLLHFFGKSGPQGHRLLRPGSITAASILISEETPSAYAPDEHVAHRQWMRTGGDSHTDRTSIPTHKR